MSGFVARGDVLFLQATDIGEPFGRPGRPPRRLVPPHAYAYALSAGAVRWKVRTARGGVGSTPTVVGESVYFAAGDLNASTSLTGETVERRGDLGAILCVDAASGATRWRFLSGVPDGSFSSPAVHEGVVYVASRKGMIYALDATTGKLRWRTSCGTGRRPVAVDGSRVYYVADQGDEDARHVGALDRATGAPRWRTPLDAVSHAVVDRGRLLVLGEPQRTDGFIIRVTLLALSASDGSLLWRHVGDEGAACRIGPSTSDGACPAVDGDRAFFTTFYGQVYAVDVATGERIWKARTSGPIVGGPSVAGGVVYTSCHDHHLYAFDRESGRLRWKEDCGHILDSSPVVEEDRVYTIDLSCRIHEVRAAREPRVRVRVRAPGSGGRERSSVRSSVRSSGRGGFRSRAGADLR